MESSSESSETDIDVTFKSQHSVLAGTLRLPDGPGPHAAVVCVAGSGPADRTGYGIWPPHAGEFARRGLASLSWDKPGVGRSTGEWKTQTNPDRAREVLAAIEYLQSRKEVDPGKIGLWGISQAGWVLPLAYSIAPGSIAFMIAVSIPLGTGEEQEKYRLEHSLTADGFSGEEVTAALVLAEQRFRMMSSGAPFQAVARLQSEARDKRWFSAAGELDEYSYRFLAANAFFDPSPLWKKVRCPVLAVFGDLDTVVDWRHSSRALKEILADSRNPDYRIEVMPGADHAMLRARTGGLKELRENFERRVKLFAVGYLETIGEWAERRFADLSG